MHPPRIDPAQAGSAAIEQYDADGDGELSREELGKVPGILGVMGQYDLDGNSKVSAEEISSRLRQWEDSNIGIMSAGCRVTLDGAGLEGAVVKLIPEEFLGEYVKPASGTTKAGGGAALSIDPDDLPSDQQMVRGVQRGIYKIEVTHPSKSIPPQYNLQTTLGQEIVPGVVKIVIPLTSR